MFLLNTFKNITYRTGFFRTYNVWQCASFKSLNFDNNRKKSELLKTNCYPVNSYLSIAQRSLKRDTISKRKVQNNFENTLFAKYYQKLDDIDNKRKEILNSISPKSLVDKSPSNIKPYLELARVDKPIGSMLLYYPCAYSICLATPFGELPSFYYLALFGVGAVLMRGAGCTINDLWDRDLDKEVERTKGRPIASGKISPQNAIKFLALQLSLSLGILLTLNPTCIMIGCAAMVPVILYPLAKRYTMFPQAVLGLTFNIGAVMGYVAVTGVMNWPLLMTLYASCFVWTLYYDLIYAFQDVQDDKRAGIKSMALLFQRYSEAELREKPLTDRLKSNSDVYSQALVVLCALSLSHLSLMSMVGYYGNLINWIYSLGLLGISFHFASQMYGLNLDSREDCWEAFTSNQWVGFAMTMIIIFAILSSKVDDREDVDLSKSKKES